MLHYTYYLEKTQTNYSNKWSPEALQEDKKQRDMLLLQRPRLGYRYPAFTPTALSSVKTAAKNSCQARE